MKKVLTHIFSQVALFFIVIQIFATSPCPVAEFSGLSSVFGEYRVGHFHAGLDYRAKGGVGMKLYSPYSGYIQRVTVTTHGYGKVVYLKTNDDYVVVFAHMDKFPIELEKVVREAQEKQRAYPLQLWFKSNEFPVEAGELIGYMGHTGSALPHLHFEVRKKGLKRTNPFLLGFETDDRLAPMIRGLAIMPRTDKTFIEGSADYFIIDFSKGFDSDTIVAKNEIELTGPVALALNCCDREGNKNLNQTGIYKIQAWKNGELFYHVQYDSFSYSNNRAIGLVYDLALESREGGRFQRLYNPLDYEWEFLPTRKINNRLELDLAEGESSAINVQVEDYWGHSRIIKINIIPAEPPGNREVTRIKTTALEIDSSVQFSHYFMGDFLYVKLDKSLIDTSLIDNYLSIYNFFDGKNGHSEDTIFVEGVDDSILLRIALPERSGAVRVPVNGAKALELDYIFLPRSFSGRLQLESEGAVLLDIPEAAFFDDCFITLGITDEIYQLKMSEHLYRHNISLMVRGDDWPERAGVYRLWAGQRIFVGDKIIGGGLLSASIATPGKFTVLNDDVKPTISTTLIAGKEYPATALNEMTFFVKDELSKFDDNNLPELWINGKWVSADYSHITKRLLYRPLYNFSPGKYVIKCLAVDRSGNAAEKQFTVYVEE